MAEVSRENTDGGKLLCIHLQRNGQSAVGTGREHLTAYGNQDTCVLSWVLKNNWAPRREERTSREGNKHVLVQAVISLENPLHKWWHRYFCMFETYPVPEWIINKNKFLEERYEYWQRGTEVYFSSLRSEARKGAIYAVYVQCKSRGIWRVRRLEPSGLCFLCEVGNKIKIIF